MSLGNSRTRTIKLGLRLFILLCVVALLVAWWWDRTRIAANLQRVQVALDEFRQERDLPESEKTLRRHRKIAGFEKIEIGMAVAEVEAQLGGPASFAYKQKGKVVDPLTFIVNFDVEVQKRENHQEYDVRQWQPGEAMIVVIFDDGGRVVCRYASQR